MRSGAASTASAAISAWATRPLSQVMPKIGDRGQEDQDLAQHHEEHGEQQNLAGKPLSKAGAPSRAVPGRSPPCRLKDLARMQADNPIAPILRRLGNRRRIDFPRFAHISAAQFPASEMN